VFGVSTDRAGEEHKKRKEEHKRRKYSLRFRPLLPICFAHFVFFFALFVLK